ncbi:MAG TPA: AAA family ATPase [Isosphaeraceae bacterium]|jgi:type II secretory pathway predicted ATPase ExeA|nr:AAA family ATPase [Isosphaeraceae bacterium]
MWERYWQLSCDPFVEADSPFVATPMHAEAVARLVHVIEAGHRLGILKAPAGLGKTRALTEALTATRGSARRVALVSSPADGTALIAELAERLGRRVPLGSPRSLAWRRLAEAVRLCHWQGIDVLLAIDDCHHLATALDRIDLERLIHVAPRSEARVTVLQVGREPGLESPVAVDWALSICLAPLTRSEAELYITAKLAVAGRAGLTFTPRALTCLHALSGGVPRGLDRLASLALIAGAARGLEVISPEVVEAVSRECVPAGSEN